MFKVNVTDGHALDPVVKVAEVEYTTLYAFTQSNFLSLIVVFCDSAS